MGRKSDYHPYEFSVIRTLAHNWHGEIGEMRSYFPLADYPPAAHQIH